MDIQVNRIDGKPIKVSILEFVNINGAIFKVCSVSQLTNKIELQPANSDQITKYLKENPESVIIDAPKLTEFVPTPVVEEVVVSRETIEAVEAVEEPIV